MIPSGVTNIGCYAFLNCSFLKSVTLPASISCIMPEVFRGCSSLTAIEVVEGNSRYCSIDGVLFTKDKKEIITYPAGKTREKYTIPSGVTVIADSAFRNCKSLKSVVIPSGVTKIGQWAFMDCSFLKSVTLPASISCIMPDSFRDCPKLTLRVAKGSYAEKYAKEYEIKYKTF